MASDLNEAKGGGVFEGGHLAHCENPHAKEFASAIIHRVNKNLTVLVLDTQRLDLILAPFAGGQSSADVLQVCSAIDGPFAQRALVSVR